MAVDYTLMFATPCLDKPLIDEVTKEMNVSYENYKETRGGFIIDDFDSTLGFTIAYSRIYNHPFGYEDVALDEPFFYIDSVFMPISRIVGWPEDVENIIRFCSLLLQRVSDDALLTINNDTVYLIRQGGQYRINPEGGIWQTVTGQSFLARTPHTFLG